MNLREAGGTREEEREEEKARKGDAWFISGNPEHVVQFVLRAIILIIYSHHLVIAIAICHS